MNAITLLNKENVPIGPFTREQVEQKLQSGECALTDLAFVEGLSEWTPLGQILAGATAPASVPAAAYAYVPTATQPEGFKGYAGFWLRVVAIFVDGVVLIPLTIISVVLNLGAKATDDNGSKMTWLIISFGFALVAFVIRWLYFALMESSPWQATVGKKVLGLKVTTLDGQRIGFGRATGRYFGKILSALILMIGFMMAGFTERKQALHDMIAGTLVIKG